MLTCGKIFIINLQNLQIIQNLQICTTCCSCRELKINFQNVYPPCTNMNGPNGRLSGDGSAQARRHGRHSRTVAPKSFLFPPNFFVFRKICFKHMIKIKIFHHKNVFCPPKPQNLATGLVLPKLCQQLGYFVLGSIRPRDVA